MKYPYIYFVKINAAHSLVILFMQIIRYTFFTKLCPSVYAVELAFFQAPDISNPSTCHPIIIFFYVRQLYSFSYLIQPCAAIFLRISVSVI
jgi:hypothetical protein